MGLSSRREPRRESVVFVPSLKRVLQLSNVAGPLVAHEAVQFVGSQNTRLNGCLSSQFRGQVRRQLGKIFHVKPQRRKFDNILAHAVYQIFSKDSLPDEFVQVRVGRKHDGYVHLNRALIPKSFERAVIQEIQKDLLHAR